MKLSSVPLLSIAYRQLYFLQLENYDLLRFLKLVPRSYTFSSPLRQEMVWTPKMLAVANIAILLEIVCASVIALALSASLAFALLFAFLIFLLSLLFHFIFLSLAVIILAPADALAKRRIIAAAQKKLKAHPQVKVIAIAGSYGKTTMKEVLATVLGQKLNVLATEGNLNTPLGISRTILQKLTSEIEVFVIEMGEHYTGDLAYLTKLFPPDIVVITGIGEAHLERFGSIEALTEGIFEAVKGAKPDALVVLNADSNRITENFKAHLGGREVIFYTSHKSERSFYAVRDETFRDGSGISFSLAKGEADLGRFSVPLLGEYAIGVSMAACIVGERLGLSVQEIRQGLEKVQPVPHRLQVVPSANGVLVIDDSYNGNPEGARYAIETLARFADRRKVYITPGLVEAGANAKEIHKEIGSQLAGVADIVVLIRNTVTPFIAEGLEKGGFQKENTRWFTSALEAHAALPSIIKTGDVVVFQNDWPDNYA